MLNLFRHKEEADKATTPLPCEEWKGLPVERRETLEAFYSDVCDLLKHRIEGQMATWAYLNGGREPLERFFNSPDYEGNHEKKFIPEFAENIARELPDGEYTIIEIGPGNTFDSKTSPFMKAFGDAAKGTGAKVIKQYIPVDIVPAWADLAAKKAREEFNVSAHSIIRDYMTIDKPVVQDRKPNEKVLVLSFNPPVWNAACKNRDFRSEFIYANQLMQLGRIGGPNSEAVLTHYPARDIERLKEIYRSDDCRQAVMAIPALIESELAPDCHYRDGDKAGQEVPFSQCFDYDVAFDDETQTLRMQLVSKANIDVRMGDRFFKTMDKGEVFTAVSSAKPSMKVFNEIARMAKADVHNNIPNPYFTNIAWHLHFNNG